MISRPRLRPTGARLARRVYFDLVGMPPSLEEMHAFLATNRRTLTRSWSTGCSPIRATASAGAGTGWTSSRYGETSGLEGDGAIGNAWRYRDWVIEAFNANMPYDRFVIQQMAGGDEHSKTRNNYQPDIQGQIPTGIPAAGAVGPLEPGGGRRPAELLQRGDHGDGSVFLGLTVGCARCHDHKYDPIPHERLLPLPGLLQRRPGWSGVDVPYKDKAFAAKSRGEDQASTKQS